MSPKISPERKQQRITEIIDAAERVFLRKGYLATSMQDIMEEAGVSRGGLYLYFSNKDELMRAVIERTDAETHSTLENLTNLSSAREGVDTFLTMLFLGDGTGSDEQEFARLKMVIEYVLEPIDTPDRRNYMTVRGERVMSRVARLFQAGVESGEFTPRFPVNLIAKVIISMQDGLVLEGAGMDEKILDVAGQVQVIRAFTHWALGLESDSES